MPRKAVWCSVSATVSKCCAKPDSLPGALLHNEGQKFIAKNVFIRPATRKTVLTNAVPDKALKIPIAHGEGRYHADCRHAEDAARRAIRCCSATAMPRARSIDGANPNGSKENIAGVCNSGPQRLRHDAAPGAGLR